MSYRAIIRLRIVGALSKTSSLAEGFKRNEQMKFWHGQTLISGVASSKLTSTIAIATCFFVKGIRQYKIPNLMKPQRANMGRPWVKDFYVRRLFIRECATCAEWGLFFCSSPFTGLRLKTFAPYTDCPENSSMFEALCCSIHDKQKETKPTRRICDGKFLRVLP